MNPDDRPAGSGALLAFTLCVAALTLVLWIEWASSQDRGLFAPSPDSRMAADHDVAAAQSSGG